MLKRKLDDSWLIESARYILAFGSPAPESDPSFVSYRHGVGYRRWPGHQPLPRSTLVGRCPNSLWSNIVVKLSRRPDSFMEQVNRVACSAVIIGAGCAQRSMRDGQLSGRSVRDCCATSLSCRVVASPVRLHTFTSISLSLRDNSCSAF